MRNPRARTSTAPRLRGLGGLALAGAAALLGACGSSHSTPPRALDTRHVEQAIAQSVLSQRHVHAYVTCPNGVQQKQGVTFVCLAVSKLGSTSFTVTQKNDRGYVYYRAQ